MKASRRLIRKGCLRSPLTLVLSLPAQSDDDKGTATITLSTDRLAEKLELL